MVAALHPLISDQPPEAPRKAGLGDRFHYFSGRSGRRYLFSRIAADELADFSNAVLLIAEPTPGGRLSVRSLSLMAHCAAAAREYSAPVGCPAPVMLIHLMAASQAQRLALVEDLSAAPLAMAA